MKNKQDMLNLSLINALILTKGEERINLCERLIQKGASIHQPVANRMPAFFIALELNDKKLTDLFFKSAKKQGSDFFKQCINMLDGANENIAFKYAKGGKFKQLSELSQVNEINLSHKNLKGQTVWQICYVLSTSLSVSESDKQAAKDVLPILKKAISKQNPSFDFTVVTLQDKMPLGYYESKIQRPVFSPKGCSRP